MAITIRTYRPDDRDSVRHICYQTGYMGSPIAPQWADEPSFANLFTSYYTDCEPESALVAERDGVGVGYLLGCPDTARSARPSRIFLKQVVTRFIAFRPGTARFVRRSIGDTVTGLVRHEPMEDRFIDSRRPADCISTCFPRFAGTAPAPPSSDSGSTTSNAMAQAAATSKRSPKTLARSLSSPAAALNASDHLNAPRAFAHSMDPTTTSKSWSATSEVVPSREKYRSDPGTRPRRFTRLTHGRWGA